MSQPVYVPGIVCADITAHHSDAYTHGACAPRAYTSTIRALKTREPQLGASVKETHLTFQSEAIGNICLSSTLSSR
jgi:hypothetical protein